MRKRVFVSGHRGMVGSAILRRYERDDVEILTATRAELDLREQADVRAWFARMRPDEVVVAAGTVGGILANDSRPATFLYDNVTIASNVIDAAHASGVDRLIFIGSSCIYPKLAAQPIAEGELLSGPLEPTNEWYAIAKIAGIKLCQAYRKQFGRRYISIMPCNLYGPGDNYDLDSSHVLPALLRKFHEGTERASPDVVIWGSGSPLREFMHVDDLADAVAFLLERFDGSEPINCGYGSDLSIRDLAATIARITGFTGALVFDRTKPDGTPRKLLDSSRMRALGWGPRICLEDGIAATYRDFLRTRGEQRHPAPLRERTPS